MSKIKKASQKRLQKKSVSIGKHRPVVIKTKTGFKRPENSRLFPHQITLTGEEEKGVMAGLPKVYAKMGFKKGWAAYKRSGKTTGTKRRKHHSASRLSGDFSTPALLRSPVRKLSSITPGKVISPIIDLGLIIIGMVLAAGLKKVSPIKNPHLMNGAQTVVGVGGSLMTKNRFIKMPLLGVALQSTIAEAKILFPKMVPLAGDDEVVYLPVGTEHTSQIEYAGEDDRIGTAIGYDDVSDVAGDDDRIGMAIGEDDHGDHLEGNNS